MADKQNNKDYLTTTQAAKLLSVSPDTVLKWVKAGKIKSRRTLGGHFRIPISELDIISPDQSELSEVIASDIEPLVHQYCWEYLGNGGEIKPECEDCITYRSRARRCYQLKDLPEGLGCLNIMCDTNCDDCEYFKLVSGQALNVLVLSENHKLIKDIANMDEFRSLRFEFAISEYEAAVKIQEFRPDYIIVDCSFGKRRTGTICRNLFNDIRIPVIRIILSSKTKNIEDYCDREVFSWIKKPFTLEQLRECIRGVPKEEKQNNF